MTKEDSVRPPRLATWLLELFSPILQNAPLAGDLAEAFKQGRSSGWYWRQVFVAVLLGMRSFSRKQLGSLAYGICCSAVSAFVWSSLWSPYMGRSTPMSELAIVYHKVFGMQWPWSMVFLLAFEIALPTCFQGLTIAVALSIYLSLFRSFTPKNLVRALPAAIIVLAFTNAVLESLPLLVSLGFVRQWAFGVAWWVPFSGITLVALLLGMWKSTLSTTLRPVSA